jgi:hypothetical protein
MVEGSAAAPEIRAESLKSKHPSRLVSIKNSGRIDMPTWEPRTVVAKAVHACGFDYDPENDIISSRMDAWQRKVGYCWKYDQGAPLLGFIIDCEPICFTYGGAKWMIELWKGQYGIETGAEIGVYKNTGKGVVSTGLDYLANWYACADGADIQKLQLSFRLKNGDREVFPTLGPKSHWWLTGFKWGEFTKNPSDLTMDVAINFMDVRRLQYEFTDALWKMGYQPITQNQTVKFTFKNPKTHQPDLRSKAESMAQSANEKLVEEYNKLKAALGLKPDDPQWNDPNKFDIQDAAGKTYDFFARYSNKIWRR